MVYYIILFLSLTNIFTLIFFKYRIYITEVFYKNKLENLEDQNYKNIELLENLYSSDKIKSLVDIMSQKLLFNYDREKKDLETKVRNYNVMFEKNIFDNVKTQFNEVKNDLQKQSSMISLLNKDVESVVEIRQMLLHPQKSGKLCEITLVNILSSSGLVENIDFVLQQSIKTSLGDLYRPDVIVFLPNKYKIIIDAKSSTFFLDDKKSVKLIKEQIRDLKKKFYSEKVYDDSEEYHKLITLLYLPSDSLLEKLYIEDPSIINLSNESNIFLVGPISLIHMITLARISIFNNKKVDNFEKIFFEVDLLLEGIMDTKRSMSKIHNSIKNLNKDYEGFDKSYVKNILPRAERLKSNQFTSEVAGPPIDEGGISS